MTARTIRTTINQTSLQIPLDGGEIANAVILGPEAVWFAGRIVDEVTLPEGNQ